MKFIFSYLKKYAGYLVFAMALKLASTGAELLIPYILEYLLDHVAPTGNVPHVLLGGAGMLFLAVLARTLNVTANRRSVKTAELSTLEIRRDLFASSVHLSGRQTDQFGLPSLTSRMTSDSYNVQSFIQSMQTVGVRAPIMLFGGIIVTLSMDRGLGLILCALTPVIAIVILFISLRGIPLYERVQQSLDDVVRVMRENITGIRVVKALAKETYEKERFGDYNRVLTGREKKAGIIMSLPGPLLTLTLNIGLTGVILVGARRVNDGVTQPGVILAFLTYFNMILMGVMGLNRIFMMMSKANASANRIAQVVHMPAEPVPIPAEEAAVTDSDAFLVFDDVTFNYNAGSGSSAADFGGEQPRNSLEHISFELKKGGSLGIIGATGSGKTTIINLLMRFYDPTSGHIFLDGKDLRLYEKADLRRRFGTVFQNDIIFADTLVENIAFGRDLSLNDVRAAASDAMAAEFIEKYEDEYDHMSTIHGANFSGGQRQRLYISRALAGDPEILILDDSSSALDYKTDAMLRSAIREHHAGSTSIIIAQRVSSILSLDHILVLDEGCIAGYGTHEELLQTCPQYLSIYRTQMGEGD